MRGFGIAFFFNHSMNHKILSVDRKKNKFLGINVQGQANDR